MKDLLQVHYSMFKKKKKSISRKNDFALTNFEVFYLTSEFDYFCVSDHN